MASNLQIGSKFDSNTKASNQGDKVPPWVTDDLGAFKEFVHNRKNWYWDGTDGDNVTDFFYNQHDNILAVQYGQDCQAYASTRFFSEIVSLENETIDENNNINVDVKIKIGWIGGYKTTHAVAGWRVTSTLTVAGQQIFQYTGNTIDEYYSNQQYNLQKNITVPPLKDSGDMITLHWNSHYPDGQSKDLAVTFGIVLKNPLPPVYRPNALRVNDSWHAHNDYKGEIKIRQYGSWLDASTENGATSLHENTGHNRVRVNGKWLQAPKMKGGNAIE